MRTVSFSARPVQQLVTSKFISHAINTEGDPSSGVSVGHAPRDPAGLCIYGNGHQNVQVLFLTPDAQIFHTASGFRNAEQLLEEVKFAENLFEEMQEHPAESEKLIVASHEEPIVGDRGLANDPQFRQLVGNFPGFTQSNRRTPGPSGSMTKGMDRMMDRFGVLANLQGSDHTFMQKYPLMPLDELLANPRKLVGNSTTFFQSGPGSGGRIGGR